jgi:Ni,Fe-hydrogenase III large subunit
LGYAHKGVESLMSNKPIAEVAKLAGRVSGDSTVAYSLAFARAVEAAQNVLAPPRAHALRALMAELERIANHLFDIGAICNDAAFAIMLSHMGVLRESVLRTAQSCFGHRLMMDRIIPGGVTADLTQEGHAVMRAMMHLVAKGVKRALSLYDNTPSLFDRTSGTEARAVSR